jgi:hypothetical protein
MSKSNAFENDLMQFTFQNTAVAGIGTTLYISLHTADPGEAGDQTANEAAYTGYARVAVNRNSGSWTVAGNAATNTGEVLFPTSTSGPETITHAAIGVNASGAGKILYRGALASGLVVNNNIAPRFVTSAINVQED